MLKRFRKRFIKYDNLVISPGGQFITTKTFKELFPEIPDTVFEDNSMVTMNDWHPSKIFSASNAEFLLNLVEHEEDNEKAGIAIFILIGAAMNCLLRGKNLEREQQLILAICRRAF